MTAVMTEREAAKVAHTVEAQVAERDQIVVEIADLRRREAEAVEQAMRDGKQARGPSGKAEPLRRKREAKERRLVELEEFEIPSAQRLAAEAEAALKAARIAQARLGARSFDAHEAEAIQRIAFAYEELSRGFAALADAAEGREAVLSEIEAELSEEERSQLSREFVSTLSPFPVSIDVLVQEIRDAVTSEHFDNPEYRASLAQRYPIASRFAELLADARKEQLYRRVNLRWTDARTGAS